MQKFKSIVLLFILGIMLFPWQMVCLAHPFGHKHHKHNGPSPCEIRKQYTGTTPVYWPPMDCYKQLSQLNALEQPEIEKIKPIINALLLVSIHKDLILLKGTFQIFNLPPYPKCRSATHITDNYFRGPPIV